MAPRDGDGRGLPVFVVTERELFDSSIASLGALAGVIPALVKAIGLSREGSVAAATVKGPGDNRQRKGGAIR